MIALLLESQVSWQSKVIVDMISGEVVSIFTKKKIIMRAGETDRAVSFKDSVH